MVLFPLDRILGLRGAVPITRFAADVPAPPPPPHTHTFPPQYRLDVAAPVDVETPAHLMSEEEVEALVRERQPAFVPLAGPGTEGED